MTSTRRFLIVVTLSVVCLTNFTAALQGYRDSLQAVERIEEQQLREKSRSLAVLATGKGSIPADLYGSDTLYQVWHGSDIVAKSYNAPAAPFFDDGHGFHFKSYGGHQWLLYRSEASDLPVQIAVALKHRGHSSLTEDVLIRTILPIIWVLPIVGILVWIIVSVGLKPLRRLASQLESRAANDFSEIDCDGYTEELRPIASALNGLFRRLDSAFEREKRFSADAAHELRTPLAALKINLHNFSRTHQNNEFLESLVRTANRMEHSIEQLLDLHKVAMDAENSNFESVNLYATAQEVIVEYYDQLSLKEQDISLEGTECLIRGLPSSIAIVLRNLIDNASKYTPVQGSIRVTIADENGSTFLQVEDSGPGVPESAYHQLSDRFFRVGGDLRDSQVHGSGLGLSIVADIVRMHGADIRFSQSEELGGLSVTILFPLSGTERKEV